VATNALDLELYKDPRIARAVYTEMEAEWLRRDLRRFVAASWSLVDPNPFVTSWELDAICDHLAYVTLGDIRNLMINVRPRSTKSMVGAVLWPTWWWSDAPQMQFLAFSYAHPLALRDAIKMRELIRTEWYQERYGGIFYLDPVRQQQQHFWNDKNGYRFSTSLTGKSTGYGGDVIIGDDPHLMSEVHSDTKRARALASWDNAMRSRLNNPKTGQKVIIGQRGHDMDLFGHIMATEGDRWVILSLPNEFDPRRKCITYANPTGRRVTEEERERRRESGYKHALFQDPRKKKGELVNPERFGQNETDAEKEAMTEVDYEAQYNQDPEAGGGIILKRAYWRQWVWPDGHPKAGKAMPMPPFDMVFQVYDTAFKEKQTNDFSARTTWATFQHAEPGQRATTHMMLMERMNERLTFPDLKTDAIRAYKAWEPDHVLIEDKASGQSLIQEFEEAGLPVWKVAAGPEDDVYRAHMVAPILKGGRVWYVPRDWAYEVIAQCAKFPLAQFTDMTITVVIGLAFLRRMGQIDLDEDEEEENELKLFRKPKIRSPYG
jgi:phage terminase large subunit-like protein